MKPWKRYLVLLMAFLLLMKVFSCRLVDYNFSFVRESCLPLSSATEISLMEANAFLAVWSEYMAEGLNNDISDKVSLISGELKTALPWKVNFWLNRHCWTAERFYYVEQRLRAIIRTLYLREHTQVVKEILSVQMKNEIDENKKASYQSMIDMQDAIANVEVVSEAELQIVRGREQLIENVLNGKTLYKQDGNK